MTLPLQTKHNRSQADAMLPQYKPHTGLTLLVAVTLIAMTAAAWVDRTWAQALDRFQWPWLESIMSRSVFEGERLGANDPVLLILLGAILAYYLACRRPTVQRWAAWRPHAGFTLVSALVTGIYFVHGLKWTMGRARPDLVLEKGLAFSHWFAFGPHFITDGIYYGSFPSGHTSQMFILMAGAFILAGDPLLPKPARLAGRLWGGAAVGASLLMGLSRCMTLSHWVTDVLASILLGWIIMHLLYYHILRVPDQRRFIARRGAPPDLPEAWEIILCLHWLVGVVGVMMMVTGVRTLLMHKDVWLLSIVPAGAMALWFSWNKTAALLRKVWRAIDSNIEENGHPY